MSHISHIFAKHKLIRLQLNNRMCKITAQTIIKANSKMTQNRQGNDSPLLRTRATSDNQGGIIVTSSMFGKSFSTSISKSKIESAYRDAIRKVSEPSLCLQD